jgi:hypothetical protein
MPMRYVELVEALAARQVRFVIVGGVAVILHGVPRSTFDLDVLIELSHENVAAFIEVMTEQGLSPRAPVDPMGLADPVVRGSWIGEKHMKAFSFSDPRGGTVDVLLVSPVDHQAALLDAQDISVRAAKVKLASIPTLIKQKEAAGRERDRLDIEALQLIQRLTAEELEG